MTPLESIIIDCRSTVFGKIDLSLRLATQVTGGPSHESTNVHESTKLLLLLREKIRAFLLKLKIFGFSLKFLKLFVEVMTIRYFVLLSYSLMSLSRSEFHCQEFILQFLHFLIFSRYCHFECFHASYL